MADTYWTSPVVGTRTVHRGVIRTYENALELAEQMRDEGVDAVVHYDRSLPGYLVIVPTTQLRPARSALRRLDTPWR